MTDVEEAVIDEAAVEKPQGLNPLAPELQEERVLKLTKGQLMLIYGILEQQIRPQGFEMIEWSMDLLGRFRSAIEDKPKVETFVQGKPNEVVKSTSNIMPNNIGTTIPKKEE
tara:strand:+ start:2428 stop:2763 length:336 start_codon:yes stop_codon:yes gene_type:complete